MSRVCPGRVVIDLGTRRSGVLLVNVRRATSGTLLRLIWISPSTQSPAAGALVLNLNPVGRIPMIGKDVVRTAPATLALIRSCSSSSEGVMWTRNVIVFCPSGIMTCAGRSSRELVVESLTGSPPAGAAALSETPQLNVPGVVGSGEQESAEIALPPLTRPMEAVSVMPLRDAVITAVSFPPTAPAVTGNAAELEPEATTTDAGAPSDEVPLATLTVPPAGLDRRTVHSPLDPDVRLAGVQLNEIKRPGLNSEIAVVSKAPFSDTVRPTVSSAETVPAVTVKLADVDPEATDTDGGALKELLLVEICAAPPVFAESVTVQAVVPPLTRLVWAHVSELIAVATVRVIDAVRDAPFSEAVIVAV